MGEEVVWNTVHYKVVSFDYEIHTDCVYNDSCKEFICLTVDMR